MASAAACILFRSSVRLNRYFGAGDFTFKPNPSASRTLVNRFFARAVIRAPNPKAHCLTRQVGPLPGKVARISDQLPQTEAF